MLEDGDDDKKENASDAPEGQDVGNEEGEPAENGEKLDFGELSDSPDTQHHYESVGGEEAGPDYLGASGDLSAMYNIPVQVSAILGTATLPVSQLLKLGRGAVIDLDRRVGESIDICVNNRLVARGEIVVVDERLGITMTEIIKGTPLK